jgi:hypothetical protein
MNYRKRYNDHIKELNGDQSYYLIPIRFRSRSMQHKAKTLSSFEQDSMIHIWDEGFPVN